MPKGTNNAFRSRETKGERDELDKELGIVRCTNGIINIHETRQRQEEMLRQGLINKDKDTTAAPIDAKDAEDRIELFYRMIEGEYAKGLRTIPPTPLEIISFIKVPLKYIRNYIYEPRYANEKGINVIDEALSRSISELYTYSLQNPSTADSVKFICKSIYPEIFNEKYELLIRGSISHTHEVSKLTDAEIIRELEEAMNKIKDSKTATVIDTDEYEVN